MPVIELTNETLSTTVENEKVVVVDFWAPWCGPCKRMAPILDEVAKTFEGQVVITKVNVDENPEAVSRFEIMSIPTLVVFKDGEVVDKMVGLHSKEEIEALVRKQL